jgi:hypothetical protein
VEPDFDVIIPIVVIAVIGLVGVFVLLAIVRALRRASTNLLLGSTSVMDSISPQGVRARGLVLTSNRVSSGVTVNGRRFERRSMTLDIEIPGRPPFVTSGSFLVPRGIVEALPGSSLELSIHATDMSQITVLGPGGFTGPWLKPGPPNTY